MTDTTEPQAVSRLNGTLDSVFGVYIQYLRRVGTNAADSVFYRLAYAIATGLIPYINGRDNLLQDYITVERRRITIHDAQIAELDQRLFSVESRCEQVRGGTGTRPIPTEITATPATTSVAQIYNNLPSAQYPGIPVLPPFGVIEQQLQDRLRALVSG